MLRMDERVRSGMDVLKVGEEETQRGGVESHESITGFRQYLEKGEMGEVRIRERSKQLHAISNWVADSQLHQQV